ncbi:hypothetical protein L210DRAFT_2757128 [Boletus edulis BED1]|uniref:Rhodopsin domain-containing protein n=1 Tax=Boletus edulis BED1 TaxID=1328754 RepID=A0AAD4BKL1_BOLED|nr:hypothetical protein L210DRAFT_2757128 [Boletus edulis BED1]
MNLLPWSLPLKIIACVFHSFAIISTIFRLAYRWYMARFWWDDGFSVFALAIDVMCLICTWLDVPYKTVRVIPPQDKPISWILAMGFTTILWSCRASILFSIIRVANLTQQFRRVAWLIGCSFLIMWAAIIGQKLQLCVTNSCIAAGSVALSQLITDIFSDVSLVILPIYLLRRRKIDYRQRILIYAVFSATLLITVVTIFHSVVLFTTQSTGIVVIGHVKVALSLIVCNLLVIVMFVYRVYRRGDLDAVEGPFSLTTVDLNTRLTESATGKYTMTRTIDAEEKVEGYVRSRLA